MSTVAKLLIFILASAEAHGELTIFDVRKNLALSDTEKVYRDFYINGGSEAGLTTGMIITVQRRLPLYDNYSNRSAGDLDLKVAKIKVIHVQKGLAVARLHSEYDRSTSPLLEDNFIMVGDRLDLATAVSDKSASNDEEAKPEAAAPVRPPEPIAAHIPKGQIVVNSVELSSESKKPVDLPTQQ